MLKKIHLLFGLMLAMPAASHALSGGPFDNGDASGVFDDQGYYQVAFHFRNGLGFGQFGNNVGMIPTTGANSPTTKGTVLNRSVLYYKGVTYVGTCFGMVDHARGLVTGVTNANSDVGATAVPSGNGTALSTVVVKNGGRNLVANTSWECRITQKQPILKFNGKGELAVLNPDSTAAIADLATAIVNNSNIQTLNGLATALSTPIPVAGGGTKTLADILAGTTVDSTFTGAEVLPLTAFGERKFFLTLR